MRPAIDLLSHYAAYHRDRRNIVTHLVGIPMIVLALSVLLARPAFPVGGFTLTPIVVIWALTALWYVTRGELLLGVAVSATNLALLLLAQPLAAASVASWLGWGIGLFVVGWIIQFLGHYYEGKTPAFVDDLVGLLVGPMFVVAEALFSLGWGRSLMAEIERRVGPTVLRDLAAARS